MTADGARHWRRGVRAALTVAGILIASTVVTPTASADDCPDAEIIFARGTGEPPGLGKIGSAFVAAVREQAEGLEIADYPVNYSADKMQLSGGDGAKDAIAHVKSTVAACPDTRIVLGGYSQGANVINIVAGVPIAGVTWGSALPRRYVPNIAAVAVFGNVANRMGGPLTKQSPLLGARSIDLCHPKDPICSNNLGSTMISHTDGYIPYMTNRAAEFVVSRITPPVPPMFGLPMADTTGA